MVKMTVDSTQFSWEIVGQQNIEKLHRLDVIAKELKGDHITLTVLAELSSDQMVFYAFEMRCIAAQLSNMVVHMVDDAPSDCFQAVENLEQDSSA